MTRLAAIALSESFANRYTPTKVSLTAIGRSPARSTRSTSAMPAALIAAMTSGDSRNVMLRLRSSGAREGRPRRLAPSPDIMAGRNVVKVAIEADDGQEILNLTAGDQGNVIVVGGCLHGEFGINPGDPRCSKAVMAVEHDAVGFSINHELGRNRNVKIFGGELGGNDVVIKVALAADGDGHGASPLRPLLLQQQYRLVNMFFTMAENNRTGVAS